MTAKLEITPRQIDLLKALNAYKDRVWESNSSPDLISIAKSVIEQFSNEEPARIKFSDGSYRLDEKGKTIGLKILENDITSLESGEYSDLKNEKFAVASTITMLINVYVKISTEEMLKVTKASN